MKVCISCDSAFEAVDWQCPSCCFAPQTTNGFPHLAPDLATAQTAFDAEEFQRLAKVEASSFWFQARNKLIVWSLSKYFLEAQSFLEVGCGTGFVLSGINAARPKMRLYGSELSAHGLSYAAQRLPGVPLMQMNALEIPFRGEFDVIGIFDVLEHIEADVDVLKQLHHSLSPNGGVLITVPQHGFLWSERDKLAGHFRRYSRIELCKKLELAGFQVEYVTSFVSVLFPLLLAQRLFSPDDSNEKAAKSLAPNRFVNKTLGMALDFERQLIKSGFSMPIGGSLLIAARRVDTISQAT